MFGSIFYPIIYGFSQSVYHTHFMVWIMFFQSFLRMVEICASSVTESMASSASRIHHTASSISILLFGYQICLARYSMILYSFRESSRGESHLFITFLHMSMLYSQNTTLDSMIFSFLLPSAITRASSSLSSNGLVT